MTLEETKTQEDRVFPRSIEKLLKPETFLPLSVIGLGAGAMLHQVGSVGNKDWMVYTGTAMLTVFGVYAVGGLIKYASSRWENN